MLRLTTLLVLPLTLTAAAVAGDGSDWNNLGRLQSGDMIRVAVASQKPVKGRFANWTADRIAFIPEKGTPAQARKDDVRRVDRFRPGGWTRGRSALLGAGIGFGGGFSIGYVAAGQCKSFCIVSPALVGAVSGGVGAIAGGVAGALVPHNHTQLIYRQR